MNSKYFCIHHFQFEESRTFTQDSRFLNVDCENFHYFYGNIDLASAVVNELSLKDLHIKNNAMTSLKFVTTVQTSL